VNAFSGEKKITTTIVRIWMETGGGVASVVVVAPRDEDVDLIGSRTTLVRERIVRVIERGQKLFSRTREFDARPSAHLFRARHLLGAFHFARVGVARPPRAPVRNLHAATPLTKHPLPQKLITTVNDVLIQIPHRVSSRRVRSARSVRRRLVPRRRHRVRPRRSSVRRYRALVRVMHATTLVIEFKRKLSHHTARTAVQRVRVPVFLRSAVDAARRALGFHRKRRRRRRRRRRARRVRAAKRRPRPESTGTVAERRRIVGARARASRHDDRDDEPYERASDRASTRSSGAFLARRHGSGGRGRGESASAARGRRHRHVARARGVRTTTRAERGSLGAIGWDTGDKGVCSDTRRV